MADNPYQAPQTRQEVTLLPAWRRHLSNLLIIVGLVFLALLVLMSAATVAQLVILNRVQGVFEPEYVKTRLKQTDQVSIVCLVLAPLAPGLFLCGLALRDIMSWKRTCITILVLALVLSTYFFWWRSESERLLMEHEGGALDQAVSPIR
jgi:hypothetical protein